MGRAPRDDEHRRRRRPSRRRHRRGRRAQPPARGGDRRRRRPPASPCCARNRSPAPLSEAKRIARPRRVGRCLRRLPRGSRLHAEDDQGAGRRRRRRDRRRHVGAQPGDPSRSAQRVVLGRRQAGGGCIVDLGCHCIEIIRSYVGKGNRPVEVMCWSDTLVHPIEAEDNAIALDPLRERRDRPVRGQLDVPRRDGPARRGRRHRRHDLDQPLPAHRLRDVLERRRRLRRREGRDRERLAVPRRRRGRRTGLRRHVHRHVRRHRPGTRATSRRSTTATSSTP